jgi:hypothetical protein
MFKGIDPAIGDFDYFVQDHEGGLGYQCLKFKCEWLGEEGGT